MTKAIVQAISSNQHSDDRRYIEYSIRVEGIPEQINISVAIRNNKTIKLGYSIVGGIQYYLMDNFIWSMLFGPDSRFPATEQGLRKLLIQTLKKIIKQYNKNKSINLPTNFELEF